jgi:hypothetical protein
MLYIIADIHSNVKRAEKLIAKAEKQYCRKINEKDIVLILGDVFGIPKRKAKSQYEQIKGDSKIVAWCDAQPFTILALRGNHDTPKKLRVLGAKRATWNGQEGDLVGKNLFYLDDGAVYDIPVNSVKSIKALILGGAFGHGKAYSGVPYTQYLSFRKKYLSLIHRVEPLKIDFVFSHDCPKKKMGVLKCIFGVTAANKVFDEILPHISFGKWYYGHHHIDVETSDGFSCIYSRVIKISVRGRNRTSRRRRSSR